MRSLPLLAVLGVSLLACGDNITPKVLVDARPADADVVDATTIDATPVDAVPVDAAPVDAVVDAMPIDAAPDVEYPFPQGLGLYCNEFNPCPQSVPNCYRKPGDQNGFCTLDCGTTYPDMPGDLTPPVGGDEICASAKPAPPVGTPRCAITFDGETPALGWGCAIACGSVGGQNLGPCPGGLTCVANLCTPL